MMATIAQYEMRRRKQNYGVVTMNVETGLGAASVFELLN